MAIAAEEEEEGEGQVVVIMGEERTGQDRKRRGETGKMVNDVSQWTSLLFLYYVNVTYTVQGLYHDNLLLITTAAARNPQATETEIYPELQHSLQAAGYYVL